MTPVPTLNGASFPPPPSQSPHGSTRANALTVSPELRRAAQGMEALFLDYLMKVMRQTVPKNEMDLNSPATEVYQTMLDTEIAENAARTQSVGLADQIIAYLQTERYNQGRGKNVSPQAVEGGTHASQPNQR
jgi:Rod binding domain-containing protein